MRVTLTSSGVMVITSSIGILRSMNNRLSKMNRGCQASTNWYCRDTGEVVVGQSILLWHANLVVSSSSTEGMGAMFVGTQKKLPKKKKGENYIVSDLIKSSLTSFRPMPTSRHSAMTSALVTACWGQAPWTPWYTCLILVLVHMFYPGSNTYVLSQSSKLHLSHAHFYSNL